MSEPARLLLRPEIVPAIKAPAEGRLVHYLSWPAWELFMEKNWRILAGSAAPSLAEQRAFVRPLLLENQRSAENDLRAIEDLIGRVEIFGSNLWTLWLREGGAAESPGAIEAALRLRNEADGARPEDVTPLLDDRLFMALWAWATAQKRRSEELLDDVRRREKIMWASVMGEEETDGADAAVPAAAQSESLTRKVDELWLKLAGPFLRPDDRFIDYFVGR